MNENSIHTHTHTHTHTQEFSKGQKKHFKLVGINRLVGKGAGIIDYPFIHLGMAGVCFHGRACYVFNKTYFLLFLRT